MSHWNSLRAQLSTYVDGSQAAESFRELQYRHACFEPHESPPALISALTSAARDARNTLLLELIPIWRRDRESRQLLTSVLILGLWRDLDVVHQYQSAYWESNVDELEALLIFHLLRAVASMNVARAPDIGQSLVRAARRDAKHALARGRVLSARDVIVGQFLLAALPGETSSPTTVSEQDLRQALSRVVRRDDIDLLVEVFINERPRSWLIERFQRSADQINVRVHRLISRLRRLA